MRGWKFVVAQIDGTPIGELTAATQRKVIWPLGDAASVSFNIDGLHPQALMPVELVTDLLAYDPTGVLRYRGRMGSSGDTVDPVQGHQSQMAAVDYRGMLDRRGQTLGPQVFTDTDQALIAGELVELAQAQDGGALGVTIGGGATTGVPRTITFTDGASVAADINQMAAMGDGFDWEVDALQRLNIFYPQRGGDTNFVLDYGGSVVRFQRTYDTTAFANALRFSGGGSIDPVTVESTSLGSTPIPVPGSPGRIELSLSDSTITDETLLALRAQYGLVVSDLTPTGYQMVLKSGVWTPADLWLGDTAQLVLRSGRINEMSRQRVTQVEVDPGDDGGEVVTITTGIIPSDEGRDIQAALQRLTLLELTDS